MPRVTGAKLGGEVRRRLQAIVCFQEPGLSLVHPHRALDDHDTDRSCAPPWVWSHIQPVFPRSAKSTHRHPRTEAPSPLVTNTTWQSLKKPEQISPNPRPRPCSQLRGDKESRRNDHDRCRCHPSPMDNQTDLFPLSVNDSPRRKTQGDTKARTSRLPASLGARTGFWATTPSARPWARGVWGRSSWLNTRAAMRRYVFRPTFGCPLGTQVLMDRPSLLSKYSLASFPTPIPALRPQLKRPPRTLRKRFGHYERPPYPCFSITPTSVVCGR